MGIIVSDVKWGMPLAVICIGTSFIWDAIAIKDAKAKKDKK
ncbi:hypothetical protein [Providencia stuartii]|nr:hypothetical protein [Providencia stuartii]